MSLQKSMAVADKLRAGNMNAMAYSKAPAGDGIFILGNPNAEAIRVWVPEHIDLDVKVDRKKRQAILGLHENERTLTGRVSASVSVRITKKQAELIERDNSEVDKILDAIKLTSEIQTNSPIVVDNPKRTVRSISWTKAARATARSSIRRTANSMTSVNGYHKHKKEVSAYVTLPILYTITARAQDLCFLAGMDETSHFIAQLPKQVSTVDEAHEALKPAGWKDTWVRQGEWFFAPVTHKTLLKTLDGLDPKMLRKTAAGHSSGRAFTTGGYGRRKTVGTRLENNSSHYATELVKHGTAEYAKGTVKDSRNRHHEDLELTTWHRVHRNKEVVIAPTRRVPQRRYWD